MREPCLKHGTVPWRWFPSCGRGTDADFHRLLGTVGVGITMLLVVRPNLGLAAVTVTMTAPGVAADGECALAEALGNFQNVSPVYEDCPYDPEFGEVIILPPSSTFVFLGTVVANFDAGPLT